MIETTALGRRFGDFTAVEGLDLSVKSGEVFGFLGPNGAGKTTTVRMLACLIGPTSGTATVGGLHVDVPGEARRIRRTVGILTERSGFYDNLTAYKNLRFYADLYGVDRRKADKGIDDLLESFAMGKWKEAKVGGFSKGMRQKLALIRCLVHDPEVLFLDEPTSGLDPVGRRLVRDVIHELRAEGTCVFLNSHLLSEIEVTCDRVAFIQHGEVVRSLELAALQGGQSQVTIRAAGLTPAAVAEMARWGRDIQANGEQITLTLQSEAAIPEITRYLVAQGADVFAISPSRQSLEEIFIETVGKDGGL
jgi:ABC-2 type transport system ATP-binding protein